MYTHRIGRIMKTKVWSNTLNEYQKISDMKSAKHVLNVLTGGRHVGESPK